VKRLEDTVHQRVRLGILTMLAEVSRSDFSHIRDALHLTDGNLSRHLQVLDDAGYVRIDKLFENRKPKTWVSVTRQGRSALLAEIAALRELIEKIDG
jgi:DNA-binding MarR family transcriptional regulator